MTSSAARALLIAAPLILSPSVGPGANANDADQNLRALPKITEAANNICEAARAEGSTRSAKFTGRVEAVVKGLMRHLVDLGVSTGVEIGSSGYQGFPQGDLLAAMRITSDCRQNLVKYLGDKMLPQQGAGVALAPRPRRSDPFQPTAAPGQPGWSRDPQTDCHLWSNNPYSDETVHWMGSCPRAVADGFGTVERRTLQFVQQITGMMVGGRMMAGGAGTLVFSNGQTITGTFQDGGSLNFMGPVIMSGAGFIYEGTLDDQYRPHGQGTWTYTDNFLQVPAMWTHGCTFIIGVVVKVTQDTTGCPYQ